MKPLEAVPGEWASSPEDPYGIKAMCAEGASTSPRLLRFNVVCEEEGRLIRTHMKATYPHIELVIFKLY